MVKKAKLSSKGQITIPIEVRKALNLQEGDDVSFELEDDGSAKLRLAVDEERFDKWQGAWREGEGQSIDEIVAEQREQRGW